jgi:carboxybiotin decarboxylase
MNLTHLWIELLRGMLTFTIGDAILIAIGAALILTGFFTHRFLYILVPFGFGLILGNFGAFSQSSPLGFLFSWGISTNLFPLLVLAGLGALADFRPLLANPRLLLGALPMLVGVFAAFILAGILHFPIKAAAAIALASALTGPGAVIAANALSPDLIGAVGSAALLLPMIGFWTARLIAEQPGELPEEVSRQVQPSGPSASTQVRLAFILVITVLVGLFLRAALPLVAAFLFGSLLQAERDRISLPNGLPWTVTRIGLILTSLLIGASLSPGSVFTPVVLKAWLVCLVGMVVTLLGFWVAYRRIQITGKSPLPIPKGPEAVLGALSALELVGLLFTGILITVSTLIA